MKQTLTILLLTFILVACKETPSEVTRDAPTAPTENGSNLAPEGQGNVRSSPSPAPNLVVRRITPVRAFASGIYNNYEPMGAFDGNPDSMWISGATTEGGPQHILFDLGAPYKIAKISLVPSIDANGVTSISTTQEITAHPTYDAAEPITVSSRTGATENRTPIDFNYGPQELTSQYLMVTTKVCAESWVAFWEIEISYYDSGI